MKSGKFLKIISIFLILIIVGCGIAAAYFAVKTDGFKPFYCVINGEDVFSAKSELLITKDQPLEIAIKYPLSKFSKTTKGYSVKVVPADADESFDFTVDDELYSFAYERDLTAGFHIDKQENGFTIMPKGDLRVILGSIYPDSTVEVRLEQCDFEKDLFKIVVSSSDGKTNINISFRILPTIDTTYISLDKEEIVF